jgi:hypothetical protein
MTKSGTYSQEKQILGVCEIRRIGRGICGVKIEEDGYMIGNVGRARTPASYLAGNAASTW